MVYNPEGYGILSRSHELVIELNFAHGVGYVAIHGENGQDPDIGEPAKLINAPQSKSGNGVLLLT